MEMNSTHKDNFGDDFNNNLIPIYNVLKFNFSDEEKLILEELRENLIDLVGNFREDVLI